MFSGCSSLRTIEIPSGVEEIGDSAFGSSGIVSITLPNSVRKIGEFAFSRTELVHLDIPEGVTDIGYGAFVYCNELLDIIIPSTVVHMSSYIFTGVITSSTWSFTYSYVSNGSCEKLTKIYVCGLYEAPETWSYDWCDKYEDKVIWNYVRR